MKQKYYDPEFGFISAPRLYKKLRKERPSLTLKLVREVVSKQQVAQEYASKRPRGVATFPIYHEENGAWQTDLSFMKDAKVNNGYKVLFTLQNLTSRFLVVEPMRNKETEEILRAAKVAFDKARASGHAVTHLESDLGSEYVSKAFEAFLAKQRPPVKHRLFQEGDHNALGVLNSAHKQMKRLTGMYCKAYNTKKWVDALPSLTRSYNRASNRMIRGFSPEEVHGSAKLMELVRADRREKTRALITASKLMVGDKVRYLLRKRTFQNREVARWSTQVHTIISHNFRTFRLDDDSERYFKSHELKKVGGEAETNPSARKVSSFDVEQHLDKVRHTGKKVDRPVGAPERRKQEKKNYRKGAKTKKKPAVSPLESAKKLVGRSFRENGQGFVVTAAKPAAAGKRGVAMVLRSEESGAVSETTLGDVRDLLGAGETWEITGIVGHRTEKRRGRNIPVFETVWRGYDGHTWEPGTSFVGDGAKKLLFKYQREHGLRKR